MKTTDTTLPKPFEPAPPELQPLEDMAEAVAQELLDDEILVWKTMWSTLTIAFGLVISFDLIYAAYASTHAELKVNPNVFPLSFASFIAFGALYYFVSKRAIDMTKDTAIKAMFRYVDEKKEQYIKENSNE